MEHSDMVNTAQLELIHAEIDGELDPRQRAELARSVLSDPAVRTVRDELQRLCRALETLPEAEPPADLRDSILAALPPAPLRRSRSWTTAATPAWRYAAMLAGVMVAGTLIFQTLRGPGPAPREVAGTLGPQPAHTIVDTVVMGRSGTLGGKVSLYRDGVELGVAFELTSADPVDVLVSSGGYTLRVSGLKTPADVALPGFPMAGQPVDVSFLIAGREVGTATLRAPKGP
ncbi:MAG: hypothetical protein JO361_08865 [Gammaproteobacteria bacterium]|nr:hypothetical protein [Gammaproteobacteria bacterium]